MAKTFGDRLKELRKERDLTMDDLIKGINVKYPQSILNKSIISRYENNIHKPKTFQTVEEISDFFGVSVNYMTGKSNDKYGEEIKYRKVPILGSIACGVPALAQEDILGYEYMLPNEKADFCLIAKGDSMINARIFDGDMVFIEQQPSVENGEIAAVLIDDEATLKRVYIIEGTIILRAENPTYKDIIITKKDKKEVCILGKAIYFKSEVI